MSHTSPDYLRVMRTAAWMWLAYLAAQAGVDMLIYAGSPLASIGGYYLAHGVPAVIFLALAYSTGLKSHPDVLTPLLLLLISGTPILLNPLLGLRLPPAPLSNVEGMVLRQLPVMLIGLVLVAWHYNLATMIIFSLGLNAFELFIVFASEQPNSPRLESFYFIILIRTVCFVVMGVFINQLITRLRAQQAALLAANAQLARHASTLETLTISRERNRMSRELHDTVVHTLSGLAVQLETAKAYWGVNPQTAEKLLDQSLAATRSGLAETRRALKALRASPLEDLGLALAIRQVAETAAQRGKLELELSLPDSNQSFAPEVEQCLYRVAQEAVENVIHHAQAQHLTVKLAAQGETIELVVQDDGIGLHPDTSPTPGHYGLAGMRERAQLAGGKLSITSELGRGTTVRLVIESWSR